MTEPALDRHQSLEAEDLGAPQAGAYALAHPGDVVGRVLDRSELESRGLEQAAVAVFGQGGADAGHGGHRALQVAGQARMIGDDIAEREAAAGLQHPPHLGHSGRLVRERAERALADHDVERTVVEGERFGIPFDEADPIGETDRLGLGPGAGHRGGSVVEADNPAIPFACSEQRRRAGAAGHVEQPIALADAGQFQHPASQILAAGMKLAAKQPANRGLLIDRRAATLDVAGLEPRGEVGQRRDIEIRGGRQRAATHALTAPPRSSRTCSR